VRPLVPYDAEVEYIESTGTQWIDTGIVPNERTSSRFYAKGIDGSYSLIIGFVQESDTRDYRLFGGYGSIYLDIMNQRLNTTEVTIPTSWCEYEFGNMYAKNITLGQYVSQEPVGSFVGDHSIWLNRANLWNNELFSTTAWGWLKIYEDENIKYDAIPVRFTNEQGESEGAMYDRVTG